MAQIKEYYTLLFVKPEQRKYPAEGDYVEIKLSEVEAFIAATKTYAEGNFDEPDIFGYQPLFMQSSFDSTKEQMTALKVSELVVGKSDVKVKLNVPGFPDANVILDADSANVVKLYLGESAPNRHAVGFKPAVDVSALHHKAESLCSAYFDYWFKIDREMSPVHLEFYDVSRLAQYCQITLTSDDNDSSTNSTVKEDTVLNSTVKDESTKEDTVKDDTVLNNNIKKNLTGMFVEDIDEMELLMITKPELIQLMHTMVNCTLTTAERSTGLRFPFDFNEKIVAKMNEIIHLDVDLSKIICSADRLKHYYKNTNK